MKTFYSATRPILLAAALLLTTGLTLSTQAQDTTSAPKPTETRRNPLGGLGKVLEKVLPPSNASGTSTGLTAVEIASGLKEALRVGIDKGATQASALDGFFKNNLIKILFPPEAQRIESRLRQLGFGKQVDQFVLALNRSAEDAAKRAKPVFWKAITQMSIQDAVGILRGSDNAATEYLRRTAGQQLVAEFTPIIDSTLQKNNATRYYNSLAGTYNKLPFVQPVNANLTEYATNKAVDGLFILVAQEEKKIRENPVARVSDILKRVFGSK
ncbi:hypothetical protein FAES_2022 [Fibrella aestuarina BUZ 2]|uniref:DUF4197 domain-containing protein n=1 Tax=Fibrella aestuarina BUZ 2 TaxID=1166018 RepID=I0K7C8_9BACT|nr:DUF4197 domain-containing protein [Fibrella aestuarina]CCH00031.1 hypothetical protein FAES_2022 [Fibrella aestuarina BUZ 2]